MSVSPDGNTRFARQENGQFLQMGICKNLGGFGSGSGYIKPIISHKTILTNEYLKTKKLFPKRKI